MRKLAMLMTIMMAFSFMFSVSDAEARKFGGGKSAGQSFKTAPASKSQSSSQQNRTDQQAGNSTGKGIFGGMMGGMLGGLLAGGLIASLLGGGGFGGIQFMDILIFGLLAFVLFIVFRRMSRARALAGNQSAGHQHDPTLAQDDTHPQDRLKDLFNNPSTTQAPQGMHRDVEFGEESSDSVAYQQSGTGDNDVPMNVPDDFNVSAFMNGARDHYRALQEAWNKSDFTTMQEYLSPELFEQMKQVREEIHGDQYTEVMFVDAEMVRGDHSGRVAQISIRFTGKYRETKEGEEENITDIWHLKRNLSQQDAPWLIIGIET